MSFFYLKLGVGFLGHEHKHCLLSCFLLLDIQNGFLVLRVRLAIENFYLDTDWDKNKITLYIST